MDRAAVDGAKEVAVHILPPVRAAGVATPPAGKFQEAIAAYMLSIPYAWGQVIKQAIHVTPRRCSIRCPKTPRQKRRDEVTTKLFA